jgi:hypothetical protein
MLVTLDRTRKPDISTGRDERVGGNVGFVLIVFSDVAFGNPTAKCYMTYNTTAITHNNNNPANNRLDIEIERSHLAA